MGNNTTSDDASDDMDNTTDDNCCLHYNNPKADNKQRLCSPASAPSPHVLLLTRLDCFKMFVQSELWPP